MSEKRKRQKAIRFRVTEDEEILIRSRAQDAKLPVASFARNATVTAANGVVETINRKSEAIALRAIVSEINRISTVTRKRVINSGDATRLVDELRRLQLLVFRFHRDGPAT